MGKEIVVTSNPAHAKEILMNQGTHVFRTPMNSWKEIFDSNEWPHGIPFSHGQDWKRRRKVLGQTLLMAKNAKDFIPVVLPAANNFVDCVEGHVDENGRLVEDVSVRTLAGMFALEAVMKVVVGVDFPACTVPISNEAIAFQQAVEIMFRESSVVENAPLHITFQTKRYQALKNAWELMYHYPEKTLQPVLQHYEVHGELPAETEGTVLPLLIEQYEQGELSMDEVLGIGVQAIAAAVDTTSQTTEYLLYNLAHNQDVQEQLLSTIPMNDGPLDISREEYDSQKYLFATLKESMRLTPTIGAHARTLVKDADLGDYRVKEGTLVLINYLAMTQDSTLFPEPHLFLPERFLKEASTATVNDKANGCCPFKAKALESGKAVVNDPYAAVPFGHGGRKCVGAGFAAMDIHLSLMALLRRFKVFYDGPELVQREDSLLRPVEPISPHFRFVARE